MVSTREHSLKVIKDIRGLYLNNKKEFMDILDHLKEKMDI